MAKVFDRAGMTVSAVATSGTGAFTLGSRITDATNGDLLTFAEAGVANGDSVNYLAQEGNKWEIGTGTYTASGTTLSRSPVKTWDGAALGTTTPLTFTTEAKVYVVASGNNLPNQWPKTIYFSQQGFEWGAVLQYYIGGYGLGLSGGKWALTNGVSFTFGTDCRIGFSASSNGQSEDVFIGRDAANVLAQRNGANAQTFNVYGNYTDAATYSRLKITHAGGTAGATIATEAGGTGTAGNLTLGTGEQLLLDSPLFYDVSKPHFTRVGYTNSGFSITSGGVFFHAIGASIGKMSNEGLLVSSTRTIGFSPSTADSAGPDTALARNAAGVIEINNGTAGQFAAIRAAAFENAQGALTSGASIAWDVRAKQSAIVTLNTNATLANPTNMVAGTTYVLVVKQDATGGRTLSYGTAYKWPGGSAPVLSTAANATDVLTFVYDGSFMLGVAQKAFA